ncbi:MAG: bifunctional precorrin-2 dehydrogenase/sirohydrochlorin ferrochelatase [Desulfobacteraceae bacterium]|jgi:precorrin-2 dehydrogenase/sirohydrochlorin ferrochelatase|nr:bifunctional precorrin-2 dehydrogenase/sirohydrochlorin ferrochelatase [Desulfobacteraceae bacterium]
MFYPVNLDIKEKQCLVVGGGSVASRKAKTLMECEAIVTVVSPEFSEALKSLELTSTITLIPRPYQTSDLDKKFLVIGATNDEKLNRRINADAEHRNMLCNIADVPDICNFILPAIIRRGDFCLAVSTSGKSPAFAKKLRKDLEKTFGDEYALFLSLMGEIRKKLLAEEHAPEAHKPIFEKLISHNLPEMIKNNEKERINRILFDVLGNGYTYDALIN